MRQVEEIITGEQLAKVWGSANFGNISRRDVVAGSLLKCACGFYTGHTAKCILQELGLVHFYKWELTKLGKEYLFAAYSQGVSV